MEQKQRIEELEQLVDSLSRICQELDPYNPIPVPLSKELDLLGIKEQKDPFYITNRLLFNMENAIDELSKLKSQKRIVQ
jgi:hypothetical protein